MREPSVLADNVPVPARIVQRAIADRFENGAGICSQFLEQAHAELLICEILGMLEWQIQEGSFDFRQGSVFTGLHAASGEIPGEGVACESAGVPSKHVSAELIEYNNRGQSRARSGTRPFLGQAVRQCIIKV